jgi:hypothetical protein
MPQGRARLQAQSTRKTIDIVAAYLQYYRQRPLRHQSPATSTTPVATIVSAETDGSYRQRRKCPLSFRKNVVDIQSLLSTIWTTRARLRFHRTACELFLIELKHAHHLHSCPALCLSLPLTSIWFKERAATSMDSKGPISHRISSPGNRLFFCFS